MITVLATIKSHHLGNIRRGTKKWEIRKSFPHEGMPFKVLCCESRSKGDIKAEFIVDMFLYYENIEDIPDYIVDECGVVTRKELESYSGGKPIYLWHISSMVDYCNTKGYSVKNIKDIGIERTPMSWQYITKD